MNIDETKFPARDRWNDRLVRQVRYTGPASYLTGGDPVNAPTELGMAEVYQAEGNLSNGTLTLILHFSYTTQKMRFYVPNTGAEVANATDLSGYAGTFTFYGKG